MVKTIAIVGLGYVGLPLALVLSKSFKVIGFDVNEKRILDLSQGVDDSGEVSIEELAGNTIEFTSDAKWLRDAEVVIVCVPTPIDKNKKPDLSYLESASRLVGENLSSGSVVVYESTVYPGVTEEVCVPILEKSSGLKYKEEFKVGYSPERMNPGDKEHTVDKIVKIVSATDEESLDLVEGVYNKVTTTHRAPTIKVAEAAKVIENIQRDINIALMNELAVVFDKMGVEIKDVLEAAYTKWNFHKYKPGLVGGHCIGVDPYYLTHKAVELGYHPEMILAGRRINDQMHKHVVDLVIRGLNEGGKVLKESNVLLMGLSFKEDVKDCRNSKAKEVIEELSSYGIKVAGCDPLLGEEMVREVFGVEYRGVRELEDIDCLVMISPHKIFKELDLKEMKRKMGVSPVIIDLKNFWDREEVKGLGFEYKSL
ncbi:nucleotide sugar dehydrogenase [Candidatus Woesearchaeota archaeon]|nr:nucleotide sugar dehydrogenase [Candidatus Woesearchaeota archaeon]